IEAMFSALPLIADIGADIGFVRSVPKPVVSKRSKQRTYSITSSARAYRLLCSCRHDRGASTCDDRVDGAGAAGFPTASCRQGGQASADRPTRLQPDAASAAISSLCNCLKTCDGANLSPCTGRAGLKN